MQRKQENTAHVEENNQQKQASEITQVKYYTKVLDILRVYIWRQREA